MHQFTYEYLKTEMARHEEGMRRAQRNGTAYEYRPRRRISFASLWRRARPAAPQVAAVRRTGGREGAAGTGLS